MKITGGGKGCRGRTENDKRQKRMTINRARVKNVGRLKNEETLGNSRIVRDG